MRKLERKISINDLKSFEQGVLYGEIVASNIYLKIDLIQTVDDMGMFTDLPYREFGDVCGNLDAVVYVDNITCFNGDPNNAPAEGSIQIVPYGGLEPYTFLWGDGSTSDTLSNLTPATYTVTVFDGYGCTLPLTVDVTVSSNADPNVTVSATQPINGTLEPLPANELLPDPIVLCEGETVSFVSDTGFVSYQWTDGQGNSWNTPNITVDMDGTYELTVTDANGCFGSSYPVTIHFVPFPTPVIEATNLPPFVTGSGTLSDPYVVCPPDALEGPIIFELDNYETYGFTKWSTDGADSETTALVQSSCTIETPCCVSVTVASICDELPYDTLIESNIICIVYETTPDCIFH